ncbi:MAG: transcriptional activator NhaR [Planctomycetota bacterium]
MLLDWINYHHLLYFYTVAKEGGVSKAAEALHLAQPTLSSQIKKLEKKIGHQLFERQGRTLRLTETGHVVFRYAEEIFGLGQELADVLSNRMVDDKPKFHIGVQGALPKLVVYELLRPALESVENQFHIVCFEGKLNELLGELALHRLDVVFADRPLAPDTHVRAFNHLLGQCGTTVYAAPNLAKKYSKDFPRSLDSAPMLLPTQNTALRRQLEQWFDDNDIRPAVSHEFEDSAVLKVFGQEGHGLFITPTAIEDDVCHQYSVKVVGRIPEIIERFYAISIEKRLKHPGIVEISEAARKQLFGSDPAPNSLTG